MTLATLKNALALSVLTLAASACSRGTIDSNLLTADALGNNNIYRHYSINYDENTNRGKADATFSVTDEWGTTVRLVQPASILIDGAYPTEETDRPDGGELAAFYAGFIYPPAWFLMGSSGTVYHKNISGQQRQIVFEFTDQMGNRFSDIAELPSFSLYLPGAASLSGFQVQVPGVDGDVRVHVRISQNNRSRTITGRGSPFFVERSQLGDFHPGPVQLEVEVSSDRAIPVDNKSLGGSISINYTFARRHMELR